jgi:hypothetical protein
MPKVISSKLLQDWTPAEAERLLQLAKRRASAARAAQLLGRRVGSVRRQAKLLGILLYKSKAASGRLKIHPLSGRPPLAATPCAKIRYAKHCSGQRPCEVFCITGESSNVKREPINRTILSPVLRRPPANFAGTRFRFERSLGDRR